MERESLFKDRSFSSVIANAYRAQTDYIGKILKASWLPALLTGVCYATMLILLLPDEAHPIPSLTSGIVALLCAVAGLFFFTWAFSRVMSLLNERPRRWNLKRTIIMTLNLIVIYIVLAMVVTGLLILLIKVMGKDPIHILFDKMWVLPLFVLCLTLLILPFYYITMRYMDQPDVRFWKDLWGGYKRGLRYFGFIFLTLFVCQIIMALLMTLVMMPFVILMMAHSASFWGTMLGDAPDMPGYFPILLWATAVAVHFVAFEIYTYVIIVTYLTYGSIEKQEADRRERLLIIHNTDHERENPIH